MILLSAQGRPFTQAVARELARLERVVLICGRYEGVDERINELYCDMEFSIGDYVLSGGELAAAVVVDAVMRLVPGVLGNEASGEFESFGVADAEIAADEEGVPRSQHGAGGLLDYPHYTRPAEFGGLRAPEVLMNGDHQQIRRWRREQQLRKTLENRPDLLEGATLSEEDRRLLDAIRKEKENERDWNAANCCLWVELGVCWMAWSLAFVKPQKTGCRAEESCAGAGVAHGDSAGDVWLCVRYGRLCARGIREVCGVADCIDAAGAAFGGAGVVGDAASG